MVLQGVLETLGIPYTHSGVLASALAMHKERAKTVMRAAGVPVAEAVVLTRQEAARAHAMPPPYVIKPVTEGSSVGVFIARGSAPPPHNCMPPIDLGRS
jgi:D-alanine-D-alanine ligase